jgi:hypothetical protein
MAQIRIGVNCHCEERFFVTKQSPHCDSGIASPLRGSQ